MKYIKSFNKNMALAKSIISKKMDGFEKLKVTARVGSKVTSDDGKITIELI